MTRLALLIIAIGIALVWLATTVRAEPCTRAAAILTGQPAPCDGDLMPARALARLLEEAAAHRSTKAALAFCVDLARVDADEAADVLRAERDARRACEESRTPPPCPRCVEPPPWYQHPAFVAPVAVVATLGVVAAVLVLR
jgi:hypothetical protein